MGERPDVVEWLLQQYSKAWRMLNGCSNVVPALLELWVLIMADFVVVAEIESI